MDIHTSDLDDLISSSSLDLRGIISSAESEDRDDVWPFDIYGIKVGKKEDKNKNSFAYSIEEKDKLIKNARIISEKIIEGLNFKKNAIIQCYPFDSNLFYVNQRIAIFASIRAWINFYREKSPRRSRNSKWLKFIYICQRSSTINSIMAFVSKLFQDILMKNLSNLQDIDEKIETFDVLLMTHEFYFDHLSKFKDFENSEIALIIDEADMLDLYTEDSFTSELCVNINEELEYAEKKLYSKKGKMSLDPLNQVKNLLKIIKYLMTHRSKINLWESHRSIMGQHQCKAENIPKIMKIAYEKANLDENFKRKSDEEELVF